MTERSALDATRRAFDLLRAHFFPFFVLGLIAAAPSEVLWTALEKFALSHVSFALDLTGAFRLLAILAGAGLAALVLLLLIEALMWGALSEALGRAEKREPVSFTHALVEAGAKFKRYFASYCAFLIPAATVDIALLCVAAFVILVPGFATGSLFALACLIALPIYVWAMGFSLLLVPAAVRGQFGAAGFRAFWAELKGDWSGVFALQATIYAIGLALLIAFGIAKAFLPDTPSPDWQKLLDVVQQGHWQTAVSQMLNQPEDWRTYLRDGVDVIRDGLMFALSGAIALCWYNGKMPLGELNDRSLSAARESEIQRSPTSAP